MRHFTAWDGSKCEYFLNRFDTDADGECDGFSAECIFRCGTYIPAVTICMIYLSESSCAKICGRPAHSLDISCTGRCKYQFCNLSASNEMIGKSEYRRSLVLNQSARLISGCVLLLRRRRRKHAGPCILGT